MRPNQYWGPAIAHETRGVVVRKWEQSEVSMKIITFPMHNIFSSISFSLDYSASLRVVTG